MEIALIDKKLKKIITVFDAFKADNRISQLEKDLLLGYLRDIYELVLDNHDTENEQAESKEIKRTSPKFKTSEELKTAFIPEVSQNIDVQSSITASIANKEVIDIIEVPVPKPEVVQKIVDLGLPSIIETTSPEPQASGTFTTQSTPPQSSFTFEPTQITKVDPPSSIPPVELTTPISVSHASGNEILSKLFIINKGSDISEKLAMSPIADIGKSMGLNERMFTITELFSGDSHLFNKTIEDLNRFSSFEEAKSYLTIHLATHQKWDQESKWEKAHTFVKLVRRRYPA